MCLSQVIELTLLWDSSYLGEVKGLILERAHIEPIEVLANSLTLMIGQRIRES